MHYTPPPRDPKAPPVRINLLSDTQTRPTPGMREAMAKAGPLRLRPEHNAPALYASLIQGEIEHLSNLGCGLTGLV